MLQQINQKPTKKYTISHSLSYTEAKTELVKNQAPKSQYRVAEKKIVLILPSTVHYNRSVKKLTGHQCAELLGWLDDPPA